MRTDHGSGDKGLNPTGVRTKSPYMTLNWYAKNIFPILTVITYNKDCFEVVQNALRVYKAKYDSQ